MAEAFSSVREPVVRMHFRWMRECGIDGVMLQRFAGETAHSSRPAGLDAALAHCQAAAAAGVSCGRRRWRPRDTIRRLATYPTAMKPRLLQGLLMLALAGHAAALPPCRIEIIDRANGWPVPLVELRSTHETRFVSDNHGLIAIDEPELLGREVWFHVSGHGYGVRKDGFGFAGVRTTLQPGGTFRIEVDRHMIAQRLGRLTGAGKYAEGEMLGVPAPLPETGVFGCDSIQAARHNGRLVWLWGDTTLPHYPLGVFHMSAATTAPEPLRRFKPPLALDYEYDRSPDGRPRGVAPMPGEGPTWLGGLVSFGNAGLGATYAKIKAPLSEYELGLCLWDEAAGEFKPERVLWREGQGAKPRVPQGHPVRWKDPAGKAWLLFGDPFPNLRCVDDIAAWRDPAAWESIDAPEAATAADGTQVQPHRGSIAWNAFRQRWITVFTQNLGKPSAFGEIWYAEAASPLGPWTGAVKVLSHDNYTFYNPRIQPDLAPEGASFILFEGTYTAEFANHAQPTPRWNYNQVMYLLDLTDPRLAAGRPQDVSK